MAQNHFPRPCHSRAHLQEIAEAEDAATRKGVALAAAEKAAVKLARDIVEATAELEALEAAEEAKARKHAAAREASFDLAAAMQVRHSRPFGRRPLKIPCPHAECGLFAGLVVMNNVNPSSLQHGGCQVCTSDEGETCLRPSMPATRIPAQAATDELAELKQALADAGAEVDALGQKVRCCCVRGA